MSNEIKINELAVSGEDKNGNPVFQATGTLNGDDFTARTIQYKGEPIFKLQESGEHRVMAKSQYGRGQRIAVARACKTMRLEVFGVSLKPAVEAELDSGETVELSAGSEEAS